MANLQNIIFFDGPDMCGKTQIAKALSKRSGIPYFKASSEHETYKRAQNVFLEQLVHADPRVLDILKQTGHSMIFDRAYPSEWVYSKLLDRYTDEDTLLQLDAGYAALGAKLIIPVRSSYVGIVDDMDPKLTSDRLQDLDDLYREFAEWTDVDTLLLNVDDEDLVRELTEIELFVYPRRSAVMVTR